MAGHSLRAAELRARRHLPHIDHRPTFQRVTECPLPFLSTFRTIVEPHSFSTRDFVGGDPALDFVNTVTGRDQSPRDWLDSFTRLIDWAALVGLFPRDVLQRLRKEAKRKPAEAMRALARTKTQRELLFALLTNIIGGSAPSADVLVQLREHWLTGVSSIELRFVGGRIIKRFRAKLILTRSRE